MASELAMVRCPACRARLAQADVCSRCGTDLSLTRRAERQAQALAGLAVQHLVLGQSQQAGAAALAASALADSPLARAVVQMATAQQAKTSPPNAEAL